MSVAWRTPYDRGSAQKPGQLSQGSGTTPTVLPGGLVAFADNAEPRMHVVVLRTSDGCSAAWTSDEVAPTSVPKVSLANGLLYVWTTRPSSWLVNAWYLTAIDVRTGDTAFSVRTGTGLLSNNHYAAVTLAPAGSAYVATLAGLVHVRDS